MSSSPELEALEILSSIHGIRPAGPRRTWMDGTFDRFAYRCLPMVVANSLGWELFLKEPLEASWNGGAAPQDVWVSSGAARGHFGGGILTFHLGCLFRTSPGTQLLAMGPLNTPKDGLQALAGVIETDWSPYTFTMNWIFTRPCAVRFEADEAFCTILPVNLGLLEEIEPKVSSLYEHHPEVAREYDAWERSRRAFNRGLKVPGSDEQVAGWQKTYNKSAEQPKLRLKPFSRVEKEVSYSGPDDYASDRDHGLYGQHDVDSQGF